MTATSDYYKAYLRQKQAREKAETLLENLSRELYETNVNLTTAYRQLQNQSEKLIQQEKLATLGFLSGGVAHEINSPVSFVKSNLQTLADYISELTTELDHLVENQGPANPTAQQKIDFLKTDMNALISESLSGIYRVENIVNTLRNLSDNTREDNEALNMHDMVSSVISTMQNDPRSTTPVKSKVSLHSTLYANKLQINQMLLNILLNAQDATTVDQLIQLEVFEENQLAVISISDNGCGIAADKLTKIFDPFYTSKDVGEGSGLGMTIALKIIKQHKGSIDVDSEPGIGTSFTIRLPMSSHPDS